MVSMVGGYVPDHGLPWFGVRAARQGRGAPLSIYFSFSCILYFSVSVSGVVAFKWGGEWRYFVRWRCVCGKRVCVRLANTRVVYRYLLRRNISAIFNCPNNTTLGACSTLCGCDSEVHRVLATRRRNTSRTTSNCTETANGANIIVAASNPNTAGVMANLTATGVSDVPLITVANGMAASRLKESDFRRISVMGVMGPIAGTDFLIRGIRSLTSAVHGTFTLTRRNEGKPILISIPGSMATGGARFMRAIPREPEAFRVEGPRGIHIIRRVVGGTGHPVVCTNNNVVDTSTDRRFGTFTRLVSTPIYYSLVKLNYVPTSRPLYINGVNVRNNCRANVTATRYSLVVTYNTEFSSHITNSHREFNRRTGVIRLRVSRGRVGGGMGISRCVLKSVGRVLVTLAVNLSHRGRPS